LGQVQVVLMGRMPGQVVGQMPGQVVVEGQVEARCERHRCHCHLGCHLHLL
jgi:hypothetical protein